jgi:hypothetical protein
MKLGIITAHERFFINRFLRAYSSNGIEYDDARCVEDFVKSFGNSSNYDGFLIHPVHGQFNQFMKEFRQNFPNARFALCTCDLGSSVARVEGDDGIVAFDYSDVEGIKKYFGG